MSHRRYPRVAGGTARRTRLAATAACAAGVLALTLSALAQEISSPEVAGGPASARAPGTPSGVETKGWGGTVAPVTFVEGAAADAPLKPSDKPRPQCDWFVQGFRSSPPQSLNVLASAEPDAAGIGRFVLGRLLEVDPDNPPNVIPSLAMSWEIGDRGRSCTYTLRRGVQFADGRPFTSADVKFSFDVLRDPGVTADHLRPHLDAVSAIEAPDPATVVVRFKRVHWKAPFLVGHGLPILNEGWYDERIPLEAERAGTTAFSIEPGQAGFAEVFNRISEPCPGTGPYHLASPDDHGDGFVHLTQNPFSWRTQVRPTHHNFLALRWESFPDEGAEFDAFVHRRLDVWVVPHPTWENQLSRDPRIASAGFHLVYDHIGLDCSAIVWNCRKEPFDDPDVRRAMTHLTDRPHLLSHLEEGHGSVAVCNAKRSYPEYSGGLEPHPFDLREAKRLLAKAGWWEDTDADGVLDRKGRPFEFEMMIPAGRKTFLDLVRIIRPACEELGLRMIVVEVSPEDFVRNAEMRRFQALAGYRSWPDPWIDLYEQYHSSEHLPRRGNLSGWKNPSADELLEQMQAELDSAKRIELFHRFNELFHQEQPVTLLLHGKVGALVARRFEGVSVRPTGLQIFDLWVRPENAVHPAPEGSK